MEVVLLPSLRTFGRPVAQRAFDGFALSVGVHGRRETVPAHRHEDEYQWCLTLEGGFAETSGSREEQCGAGSMLVRPPDCVHADRFGVGRSVCLNVFPQRSWLAAHGLDKLIDAYCHQRSRRLFALGGELMRELHEADSTALGVESLLIELLSGAQRMRGLTERGHAPWFATALDAIEADLAAELRLGDLARVAGVSAGHLARAFRAAFGTSAGAYVRERRLERAAVILKAGKHRLSDVAMSVGFCDQAHFTRAFKTRFGITPAAFRSDAGT